MRTRRIIREKRARVARWSDGARRRTLRRRCRTDAEDGADGGVGPRGELALASVGRRGGERVATAIALASQSLRRGDRV
eukprot:944181-Prymnesium_polylepis.1